MGNFERRVGMFCGLIAAVCLAASCDDPKESGAVDRVGKTSADINSSPHVSDFILYAERSITLGVGDNIEGGDVGVRLPAPSSFGTQLSVGSLSLVTNSHNLISPSVTLALASAVGDVQTNSLQNNGALLGAQAKFPAGAMPVLPLAPPPAGGGSNVTVPALQIVSLPPGNYGTLSVTGTLLLNPGTYSFASATVASLGHVAANAGGVKILVGGSLTVGQGATILPGLGFTSDQLNIAVSGSNGSGGTPVVSIGQNSVVSTLLAAPHGTLSLAKGVHATGAFAAFDIAVGDNVDPDFQSGFSATASGQHGLQQLTGYVTPDLTAAPVLGPLPPSTTVSLAIGLPLSDAQGLQTYVQQISDPTNSGYRQNRTLDSLTGQYGPTTASYNALVAWAQSKNLTIGTMYSHRLLLTVSGTAAAVEQAFYVNLDSALRPDGSSFYKLDRDPSVDLSAATATLGRVAGLDSFFVPVIAGGTQSSGTAYASINLRNAYVPTSGLTGAGQSVGIMAYGGYNHSDVAQYESMTGLPSDPSTCGMSTPGSAPCLVDVMENGFTGPINGYSQEATADIDMAIAMAPGLKSVVVFEGDPSAAACVSGDKIIADMLMRTDIKQFTSTISFCVSDETSLFDMMAGARQTFVVPSGDHGGGIFQGSTALAFNVWSDNKVVNVGGTILTMNGAGASWASEQAWLYSGGGVENFGDTCPAGCTPGTMGCPSTCIPSWQNGIATSQNGASSTYRNNPDVAMPAQNIFMVYKGSSTGYCGTSVSAPLWMGLTALVNQQNATNGLPAAGFMTPALYAIGKSSAYASSFNDITSNSTTSQCTFSGASQPASSNYDLATGWGSPRAGLIDQLSCVQCSGTTATPVSPPSSSCAKFQADANNCGSCGHACLGGACIKGVCASPQSQIAAGGISSGSTADAFTCAIRPGGIVKCVGANGSGQLGDGNTTPTATPQQVGGVTGAVAVAAGQTHACALLSNGTVSCWESNDHGELGDGTMNSRPTAQLVGGGLGTTTPQAVSISAGAGFTCAVLSDGSVGCWGADDQGQLGDGVTGGSRATPGARATFPGDSMVFVSSGTAHSCAIMASGMVACWGANGSGQLGDGSTTPRNQPFLIPGGFGTARVAGGIGTQPIVSVSAGASHSCAATQADGTVNTTAYCWGANDRGQLGDGSTTPRLIPSGVFGIAPNQAMGFHDAVAIAAGFDHSCAIMSTGQVACWGDNTVGELGLGSTNSTPNSVATLVTGLPASTTPLGLAAGQNDACVLEAQGPIQCWGAGFAGQLGTGGTSNAPSPGPSSL